MRMFALDYARPAEDPLVTHAPPYRYDPLLQVNVLDDGRPAAHDRALLRELGSTTSTAGSKTHFDD
ncbi:putative ATP-grasp-modified RiPP [Streptomyces sp. UH6]|uniref:putative ATP-grasp-modified RiPP n=1 Tax=Streptomyces sp. UH6 TaxID=2748379 RepID=UPI0015D5228F|nr:putative ATP-grasp-modified RiPP [Streptomyces sp. UH6]NYV78806.1 putative ATP-grasp-modified RiPP [Streptomyces sp. UH6]